MGRSASRWWMPVKPESWKRVGGRPKKASCKAYHLQMCTSSCNKCCGWMWLVHLQHSGPIHQRGVTLCGWCIPVAHCTVVRPWLHGKGYSSRGIHVTNRLALLSLFPVARLFDLVMSETLKFDAALRLAIKNASVIVLQHTVLRLKPCCLHSLPDEHF